MSIVIFGVIYLLGVYAFFKHAADASLHCDDDGNRVVIPFRRRQPSNTN